MKITAFRLHIQKKQVHQKSKRTDPTYSGGFSTKISVSNIALTTSGLDSVFTDAATNNLDATVKISYDTNFDIVAQTDTVRFTPYNNGNGKFPSNISRSRMTTGDGADSIKICKIVVPVGNTPLSFSFGLYLNFNVDGELSVSIVKENTRGVHIKNTQITTIKESKKSSTFEAKVNLYAGVEFRATFGITGVRTPIVDFNAGLGFDMMCTATAYLMNAEKKYTQKQQANNMTGDLMDDIVAARDGTDFNYCLDLKLSLIIYINGVTENCYVGKLIKFLSSNYKAPSKEWNILLGGLHYEDGGFVDSCSRTAADNADDTEKISGLTAGDSIDISDYNIALTAKSCGQFYVTSLPCKKKKLLVTAENLVVSSTDKRICTAEYFPNTHMVSVEAKQAGTCEILISTKGGKYKMSCAVIVNENKDVLYIPSDSSVLNTYKI